MKIVYFLVTHCEIVFLSMFGVLVVVALVNFVFNVYHKQNVKLNRFRKKIVHHPSSVLPSVKLLPREYQRQWRAFCTSKAQKPSMVFEFVKKPRRFKLLFLHLLATAVSLFYVVACFVWRLSPYVFAVQVAFWFASCLVWVLNGLIFDINLRGAKRCFGKFLHDLNTVVQLQSKEKGNNQRQGNQTTVDVDSTTQKPRDVVQVAVDALKQQGASPRTVEEQRKLNLALNNLLQACCKQK